MYLERKAYRAGLHAVCWLATYLLTSCMPTLTDYQAANTPACRAGPSMVLLPKVGLSVHKAQPAELAPVWSYNLILARA